MPFRSRSARLDRAFKVAIAATTAAALVAMLAGTAVGRHEAARLATRVRWAVFRALGMEVGRDEIEADRLRARLRGIERTREALAATASEGKPEFREFLRVAGMAPGSALIRWGNYDWTLALSSDVFEADDTGRSYRLRPLTRSTWLVGLSLRHLSAMFEIPDTAEARRLGRAIGGLVVPGAEQSTNSWGCRGPEPDLSAPIRGLVLGDSNMQGLLVGDDQAPPARLEARLRRDLNASVSILNTGVLGYSIEQYYYTLLAYHDRFRPHFVVLSVCDNDLGDLDDPANWEEARHWLVAISEFCRTRGLSYLVVPFPSESEFFGPRHEARFPGRLGVAAGTGHLEYLDPFEDFALANLRHRVEEGLDGEQSILNPLYNFRYSDHHLSPEGADLWASIVARRLELVWAGPSSAARAPGRVERPASAR